MLKIFSQKWVLEHFLFDQMFSTIFHIFLQIRTVGMAIIYTANNLFHLPSLKTYPILLESIDLHGCLMIYACGCFIGFIFILFALKETTGRSLDGVGVDMNAETKATPAKISNSI